MSDQGLSQYSAQEIEELKKKIVLKPLNSVEELRAWMFLFFDIDFPAGVVYPTSTHAPADAMWRIYYLMKTGKSQDIPQVTMLSSRDSFKTLGAAALEVLCFIHFRISIAHAAAVIDQSDKAVQYANSFFRNLRPYLEYHGWTRATDNKKKIEWITDTGDSIYLKILVMSIRGMNCVEGRTQIKTNLGTLKASEIYKKIENNEPVSFLSYNHTSNETEYKPVVNKWKANKTKLYKIKTGKSTITVSEDHQVYVKDKGYVLAKDLVIGDVVIRAPYTITKNERKQRPVLWTLDRLQEESSKYETKIGFQKNSPNAYKSAQTKGLLDSICSHMVQTKEIWDIDKIRAEALKYNSKAAFKEGSPKAYRAARARKCINEVCSHTIPLKTSWDQESIRQRALQHSSRWEFQTKDSKAYSVAKRLKILDLICSHMAKPAPVKQFSLEDLQKAALKYETRNAFANADGNLYAIAVRRGVVDKVCSHMPVLSNTSSSEKELLGLIKDCFPKAQKFVDRKVFIADKPHIQGFEVDIYIPELRKGIEFDGAYFHSIKGLKRGRPHWPDNDLVNYHEIKDTYFKSKGIEILHIGEKDWLEDKGSCIVKCMSFLGIGGFCEK